MWELERDPPETPVLKRLAIIGRGRLGSALAAALRGTGFELVGPLGRGASSRGGQGAEGDWGAAGGPEAGGARGVDAVLLCVPDRDIEAAATAVSHGPLVGHCSGATGLEVLAPHEAFSLHPLMTVTADGASFQGAGAAIAGETPRAVAFAESLARALGMRPVEVAAEDRAAYHAASSIASNFLVTLEGAAERLAATAGVQRDLLLPLVRTSVENWAMLGAERALTGPVVRGDAETVARQRAAIAQRADDLLPLFDALVEATRALAQHGAPA